MQERPVAIYLELYKHYNMIGIAIQSYLRRSVSDLLHIIECGGKVRLVKGLSAGIRRAYFCYQ